MNLLIAATANLVNCSNCIFTWKQSSDFEPCRYIYIIEPIIYSTVYQKSWLLSRLGYDCPTNISVHLSPQHTNKKCSNFANLTAVHCCKKIIMKIESQTKHTNCCRK